MTRGRKRPTRSRRILRSVGKELRDRPPRQLARTRAKFGAKRAAAQKTAILLSKSRAAGARIPKPKRKAKRAAVRQ